MYNPYDRNRIDALFEVGLNNLPCTTWSNFFFFVGIHSSEVSFFFLDNNLLIMCNLVGLIILTTTRIFSYLIASIFIIVITLTLDALVVGIIYWFLLNSDLSSHGLFSLDLDESIRNTVKQYEE